MSCMVCLHWCIMLMRKLGGIHTLGSYKAVVLYNVFLSFVFKMKVENFDLQNCCACKALLCYFRPQCSQHCGSCLCAQVEKVSAIDQTPRTVERDVLKEIFPNENLSTPTGIRYGGEDVSSISSMLSCFLT